mmetsp:Transcript_48956/g.59231  ORF Transcript_48956/g.59231 Transcript_48956/m.59231 type:complete len:230 (+) Transcript_48956:430-1119(+)
MRITHRRQELVKFIFREHILYEFSAQEPLSFSVTSADRLNFGFDNVRYNSLYSVRRDNETVVARDYLMVLPLPYLRPTNFCRCRIFHVMIERNATHATQPRFRISQNNSYPLRQPLRGNSHGFVHHGQFQKLRFRHLGTFRSHGPINLIRPRHVIIKNSLGQRHQRRMRHPRPVVPRRDLPHFIPLNTRHGPGVGVGIVLDGYLRRHASHGERTPLVTHVYQACHVSFH